MSQLTKAMMRMMSTSLELKMVTMAISRKRMGMESSMSTNRIMAASTEPPKKPAVAPNTTPTTVATKAEANPTISDV